MKDNQEFGLVSRRGAIVMAAGVLAGCGSSDDISTEPTATSTPESRSETTDTPATTTTDKTQTEKAKEASVKVGRVVEDDSLALVVRNVEKSKKLGQFQEADTGNTFVVVRLAVKNKTDSEFINFNSFWQTRVKDNTNHVYNQTFAVTDNPIQSGQLAPGEVSRGDIVFEVPDDASGLELQFDFEFFDLFSFTRIVVDLGATTGTIADLKQNLKVPIHSVGETVSKQDLAVSVNDTRTTEELGQFTQADEGMEYVIPDISVQNNTGEALSVSIALQMVVKDGTGQGYTVDIGSYSQLDQKFAQGTKIANGETRRGEVSYMVPKSASTLYWTMEFSIIADGDKTFWQLR